MLNPRYAIGFYHAKKTLGFFIPHPIMTVLLHLCLPLAFLKFHKNFDTILLVSWIHTVIT